jgi:predicted amidophosphoribosyltransferase
MWSKLFKGMASPLALQRPGGVWRWLPSRCAVCRSWPQAPLCDTCISQFAQPLARCATCALPLPATSVLRPQRCGACLQSPPPLDLCLTATAYAWPWVDLIAQLKFHQQAGWAAPLATLMLSAPWIEDTLAQADTVLPIPLSPERLAERGYNQSLLLARQLSPDKTDDLVGAFAVDPLRAAEIRGQRIVLVDDVMTSGASLHTAAQVLRQAGAAHISAVVLARTEADTA